MVGGSSGSKTVDISQYLNNFNPSEWANAANSYLTGALNQGIAASTQYNQAAINSQINAQNQANAAAAKGYDLAQALNAPQRLATYQALDAYQDSLGLARPTAGSFQLASAMENQARGDPNTAGQMALANSYGQGLLGPTQPQGLFSQGGY